MIQLGKEAGEGQFVVGENYRLIPAVKYAQEHVSTLGALKCFTFDVSLVTKSGMATSTTEFYYQFPEYTSTPHLLLRWCANSGRLSFFRQFTLAQKPVASRRVSV